jgi:hypothetical protein
MYRILYDTTTGKIHSSRRIPDHMLQNNIKENMAYINGFCPDPQTHKIDLETLQMVSLPPVQIDPYKYLRIHREAKLKSCDWTQGADSPLSEAKKAEWATYRQALRDLPNNLTLTTKEDIVWPNPPE